LNSLNPKSKVCAVIPFYNEKDFIVKVVDDTLKIVDEIIAVNDGSIDGSEKLIAEKNNVSVVTFISNKGKGSALQSGFNEAIK
jgi:glycosyltransferase involved in cell wall biosynthesis